MPVEEPTLEVTVNLAAAQRYGLNPGDVRRAAATYFSGLLVGNLYEEQKIFDVVVVGSPAAVSANNVADLRIDTPNGSQVRLGDLASIQVVPFPTLIRHAGMSRMVDVTAELGGRDVNAVLNDVKERVETVNMPLEYHVEVLSSVAVQQNQFLVTGGLAIAVAVGILLLLQAAFASWRVAAAVFIAVPLGAAGGMPAAIATGGVMTAGALLGFFLVLGVTARNGVLLVRTVQALESAEPRRSRAQTLLQATRLTAPPVLLTACCLSVLFAPLLFVGGLPGAELLHTMAAVVIAGMVSSTALTLLLVPTLYDALATAQPQPRSVSRKGGEGNGSSAEAVTAGANGGSAGAMPGS